MPQGKLQVLLVSAKGLEDADFLSNVDPYAVLTCRSQEQKSSVASGCGSTPEWNQTFIFTVTSSDAELIVKIYDKDNFSADDYLGEAKIPLEPVLYGGSLPVTSYNVVKNEEFCGEVRVSLTFTPQVELHRVGISQGPSLTSFKLGGLVGHNLFVTQDKSMEEYGGESRKEEEFGGWRQSSYD